MTSTKLRQPLRSVLIGRKLYSGPTTPAKRGSLRPAVDEPVHRVRIGGTFGQHPAGRKRVQASAEQAVPPVPAGDARPGLLGGPLPRGELAVLARAGQARRPPGGPGRIT